AGMQESGVADHRHNLLPLPFRDNLYHTGSHTNGSAHADTGVHCREGRHETKGIATNIAGYVGLELVEGKEDATVRATWAHIGRTAGELVSNNCRGFRQPKCLP